MMSPGRGGGVREQGVKQNLHETYNCCDFDQGKCELGFAIDLNAEEVDDQNCEKEYCDEDGARDITIPVANCNRCSDDFKGQHREPL